MFCKGFGVDAFEDEELVLQLVIFKMIKAQLIFANRRLEDLFYEASDCGEEARITKERRIAKSGNSLNHALETGKTSSEWKLLEGS